MNYFLWDKIDDYLTDKFGEKKYGRMWSYSLLALFIMVTLLMLGGKISFTLSNLLNSILIIGYFWLRYVFNCSFVVKYKIILNVMLCIFVFVFPSVTYFSLGSSDYLKATYAFVQCVVLENDEIILISPRYQKWRAGFNKNEYYDIYIMQKQPTINEMMNVIGSVTGEIISYEHDNYFKDMYTIETAENYIIILVEKHIEYDILKVDVNQPKESKSLSTD